ncbi:MAG TPA: packaged DNA stabilization protein, partial [Candidatus Obscuribacterales bacterium]
MKLPLVKGTRIDVDAEWRDTLPRNMVGFYQSIGSWSGYLRTADGLKSFATGFGADRGGIWSERFRQHYRLSGNTFIEVDEFGGVNDLSDGVLVPGSNQARFANSFNSVAFVANGEYYRYDG